MRPRAVVAAALAAAFLALALAVQAGWLDRPDRFAVREAMPWASTGPVPTSLAQTLFPIFDPSRNHGREAGALLAYVVTLPGGPLVSAAAVLGLCAVVRRRAGALAAGAWLLAYAATGLVEELGKTLVTRPALPAPGGGTSAFDQSYPSGHTLRAIVLAALAAALWPRARPALAAALAACLAGLELGGYHTPSDIAGGALAGAAIVLFALDFFPGNQRLMVESEHEASDHRAPARARLGGGAPRGRPPSHDNHPRAG